ncbi:DUF2778 domain-containing protein [Burkholderia gladioli]|uniref:DUF2778 domain-containing protein n=1 Tax=Burkholderia gladioli TaxID=28095 RepID=UPI001C21CD3C|nr:DUF2778 domain-containing protein [Burkholderia gladioli]MBU9186013.1 DUF2778 domain-containing protein [Burkholderia gladioli]
MAAICTFILNGKPMSGLTCMGLSTVPAFSGMPGHRNMPGSTAKSRLGPLPPGRYYIVDRQSGGRLGWLYEFARANFYGTDRNKWFALYRDDGRVDDTTVFNGARRGAFRLHPNGRFGRSQGCIAIQDQNDFDRISAYIRVQGATVPIPGSDTKAYGFIEVK